MSKKNPQILSPENYIRQRARNLPLHECLINKDWERDGLVSITISRKHINGNITFCLYLVDLLCLGVKDTFYQFNAPESDYDSLIDKSSRLDLIKVDYNLVHNIIHAGWEYGEELGFDQHKDFLSVTQFMLEEDTDEIPLMDIKCGDEDGKPLYVQGEMENDSQAKIILNHLEKKVGKGNFDFETSEFENDDDDWDENESEETRRYREIFENLSDEYENNTLEENIALFHGAYAHYHESVDLESLLTEEIIKLSVLAESILDKLMDFNKFEAWTEKWNEEQENLRFSDSEIDEQLLGLSEGQELTDEEYDYLNEDVDLLEVDEYIKERWEESPYARYKEILNMDSDSEERTRKLDQYTREYPDYALLKILKLSDSIKNGERNEAIFDYKYIFQDRSEIFPEEFSFLQTMRMIYFQQTADLEGIASLQLSLRNFEDLNDYSLGSLEDMIQLFKMEALKVYLDTEYKA